MTEPNAISAEPSPANERASLWEDFLDIYYQPREVFARRRDGRWGPVLLILTVLMGLLFYASMNVLGPAMDADFTRAMRDVPEMSAEQLAQARRMAGTFGLIGFVITFPLGVALVGLVLWLVGKLVDSVAPLAAALLIATYAQFPRLLQQVVATLQGLVMDDPALRSLYSVTLSPARFLDPDATTPLVLALAGRLDVFILWSTMLLAIGLQVLGRVPSSKSYVAAGLVWLLGALPVVLGALGGGG
jgi:hypothetical protein